MKLRYLLNGGIFNHSTKTMLINEFFFFKCIQLFTSADHAIFYALLYVNLGVQKINKLHFQVLDTEYLVSVIASESWNLSNSYIYSLKCTTLPCLHASQLYIKKTLSLNSGNKCNNSLCSESCRVFLHTFYLKRLSM